MHCNKAKLKLSSLANYSDEFFLWMERGGNLANQRPVLRPSAHAKNHIFADKNQTIFFFINLVIFSEQVRLRHVDWAIVCDI